MIRFLKGVVTVLSISALTGCISCSHTPSTETSDDSTPLAATTESTATKQPSSSNASRGDKWALWSNGAKLRGANIWQKRLGSRDGGEFGDGPVGPPYTKKDFQKLSSLGANYVNISFPGIFSEKPPYKVQPEIVKYLQQLLDRVAEADMYAVLSFRTGPGRNEADFDKSESSQALHSVWKSKAAQDAWVEMWKETTKLFAKNPVVVGFHLMVEPNANETLFQMDDASAFYTQHRGQDTDWNPFAKRMIEAVRALDGDIPILVGPMNNNDAAWAKELKLPKAKHLVLAVHHYYPYEYSHQEKEEANMKYPGAMKDGEDEEEEEGQEIVDAKKLEESLKPALEARDSLGIPLVINEFGAKRWVPGADQYTKDLVRLFDKHGLNHAVWLWESSYPKIDYDDFNFQKGDNGIIPALKQSWSKNTARPSNQRSARG